MFTNFIGTPTLWDLYYILKSSKHRIIRIFVPEHGLFNKDLVLWFFGIPIIQSNLITEPKVMIVDSDGPRFFKDPNKLCITMDGEKYRGTYNPL